MGPKQFRIWMEQVYSLIPAEGAKLGLLVEEVAKGDETGYARSDTKAALLALKAEGRIQIKDDGMVCYTNG
jgi:hypothetical protein